jgi:hypothetical protein
MLDFLTPFSLGRTRKKWSGPISGYCRTVCLEGLSFTSEKHTQYSNRGRNNIVIGCKWGGELCHRVILCWRPAETLQWNCRSPQRCIRTCVTSRRKWLCPLPPGPLPCEGHPAGSKPHSPWRLIIRHEATIGKGGEPAAGREPPPVGHCVTSNTID